MEVDARYVGDVPVWSVRHQKELRPGDIVKMPGTEAREREDFEIVKAPEKGPKSLPGKGGDD